MLRLTKELQNNSIQGDTDSSGDDGKVTPQGARRSARLSQKKLKQPDHLNDSGTESDDEELQDLAYKSYIKDAEDANPPLLSSSPPVACDMDTESWDSFGRESGILTGDGDSDDDGLATPKPRRMKAEPAIKISKEQCQFPPMSMSSVNDTAQSTANSNANGSDGNKRRHSSLDDDAPVSSRTRSEAREVRVAARRARVRVLVNKPYAEPILPRSPPQAPPAHKRSRFEGRPSLDFDKMRMTRLESAFSSVSCSRSVTQEQ